MQTQRPWAVSATVTAGAAKRSLASATCRAATKRASTKRAVRIDGVPVSNPAQLAERIRLIWLTPAMDRLFIDGVSERRRFLDRLIAGFDPAHARRWGAYEIAMRERLGALRAGAQSAWLNALERTMAEHAASRLPRRGLPGFERLDAGDGRAARLGVSAGGHRVAGAIEDVARADGGGRGRGRIRGDSWRSRGRAMPRAGRTSVGPHLTDFVVRHHEKGREARACSTGEQKALLIRLMLGERRVAGAGRAGNAGAAARRNRGASRRGAAAGAVRRDRRAQRSNLDDGHGPFGICGTRRPGAVPARRRRPNPAALNQTSNLDNDQ